MAAGSSANIRDWDAIQLLGLINTDTLSFSCVGHAPSRRRRCWNRIAQHNIASARTILQGLPAICTQGQRLRNELSRLAEMALCKAYHQGQRDDVANRWFNVIKAEVERRGGYVDEGLGSQPAQTHEARMGELREALRQLQRQMDNELRRGFARVETSRTGNTSVGPATSARSVASTSAPSVLSSIAPSSLSSDTLSSSPRPSSISNSPGPSSPRTRSGDSHGQHEEALDRNQVPRRHEAQRHEHEERRRDEELRRVSRELAEVRRREEERRQAEREREAEAQRRARWERAEANRQRRVREAREAADRERQDRADSWARYERDWANMAGIDTQALDEDVLESLPWPVKEGRWQDVTEQNVENFLRHAPHRAFDNARSFLSLLRRQALRWHEDRVRNVFPRAARRRDVIRLTTMVIQVINRMTEAARARRS